MYLGMWIWSRQPAGVGTEHQDEEEDHTTVDATPVIQEQEIEATVYQNCTMEDWKKHCLLWWLWRIQIPIILFIPNLLGN